MTRLRSIATAAKFALARAPAAPASPDPAWRGAAIVQQGRGGPIIATRGI